MSRTLHRDRVVLPSKEKGAIKLEAFLKEARTGHRARPPETGINSAGNGVMTWLIVAVVALVLLVGVVLFIQGGLETILPVHFPSGARHLAL